MSEEIVHPQGSWVAVKLGLVGELGLFRQPLPMHRAGGTPGKGPGSLRVGHLRSCSLLPCAQMHCSHLCGLHHSRGSQAAGPGKLVVSLQTTLALQDPWRALQGSSQILP